uniref:hypothetical protein n=1 Tax=Chitinophaga niabensis TaxID=536979 RepID=UPI00373FE319
MCIITKAPALPEIMSAAGSRRNISCSINSPCFPVKRSEPVRKCIARSILRAPGAFYLLNDPAIAAAGTERNIPFKVAVVIPYCRCSSSRGNIIPRNGPHNAAENIAKKRTDGPANIANKFSHSAASHILSFLGAGI